MSNSNHGNYKLKAPHSDDAKDGNQFISKMNYLKNLLQLLESAYKGFYLAHSYSNADVGVHLQAEGQSQKEFYIRLFYEALLTLALFFEDMKNLYDIMEGE
jgi:hypothetical protein